MKNEDFKFLEDCEIAYEYALTNNIKVPDNILRGIFEFKRFLQQNDPKPDSERYYSLKKEFLNAFSDLLTLIKVDKRSLLAIEKKYTSRFFNFQFTSAGITILGYKLLFLLVLIVALAIHYYWFVGLSYFDYYLKIKDHYDITSSNFNLADSTHINFKSTKKDIDSIFSNKRDVVISICKWEALGSWSNEYQTNFAGITCCDPEKCTLSSDEQKIIRASIIKLRLCDAYVLPLLYGLLGAIIFSLRNVAHEIKAYSFNKSSRINYAVRLFLGSFAGLAIGWFTDGFSNSSEFKGYNLSSSLLAFLAGYNIEAFFTTIDKYAQGIRKSIGHN